MGEKNSVNSLSCKGYFLLTYAFCLWGDLLKVLQLKYIFLQRR